LKEENMCTEKKEYRPSDFMQYPWSSVEEKCEAEIVARNVMVILGRTGDVWRKLSWTEYRSEREKDGDFSSSEKYYFESVRPYTVSEKMARSFSGVWRDVV
jgi:hypothetical protein